MANNNINAIAVPAVGSSLPEEKMAFLLEMLVWEVGQHLAAANIPNPYEEEIEQGTDEATEELRRSFQTAIEQFTVRMWDERLPYPVPRSQVTKSFRLKQPAKN